MRIRAASLAFAMVAVLSTRAVAAQWEDAGETAGGNPVYVDVASMRVGGAVRTAWIRAVYRQPIQAGSVRAARSSMVSNAPSAAAGRPSSRRSASGCIHADAPT